MLSDQAGANHSDVISPILSSSESVIGRVMERSYHWPQYLHWSSSEIRHRASVQMDWETSGQCHQPIARQPDCWLESKEFSSTLICSDQNFCPGRRQGARNSKALGGNVFSEFCYSPAEFADLRCPELDTSVPLSTWTHAAHRPIDWPDSNIKTNPFVKIFTLIMSRNKTPNPSRCVCPGGSSPPSFACHYHS